MGEIVRFPVLTVGELQGDYAGVAALYRKLPANPSVELLDRAITVLLEYYSLLVIADDGWGFDEQLAIDHAKTRLTELSQLMAAWQRRQWLRLGAP
jgi:hypothetical protein